MNWIFTGRFWSTMWRAGATAVAVAGGATVGKRVTDATVDFVQGGLEKVFDKSRRQIGRKLEKEGKELQGEKVA